MYENAAEKSFTETLKDEQVYLWQYKIDPSHHEDKEFVEVFNSFCPEKAKSTEKTGYRLFGVFSSFCPFVVVNWNQFGGFSVGDLFTPIKAPDNEKEVGHSLSCSHIASFCSHLCLVHTY